MKTWLSYATWFGTAIVAEMIAIGFSASPPMVTGYLVFYGIVLSGLFAMFSYGESLFHEPIYWVGIVSGLSSMLVLVANRNRKPHLIVLAGLLWCAAGGIGLFIGIGFAI
jgi:hypothetical protein